MMSSLLQLAGVLQDFATEIAQELIVICVFCISFMVWRHLDRHGFCGRGALRLGGARKPSPSVCKPSLRKCDTSEPWHHQAAQVCKPSGSFADGRTSRQPSGRASAVIAGTTGKPLNDDMQAKQAKTAEQQMLKNLAQREFTAALNLFRSAEREGLARFFVSEQLYSNFIQAAVRIGKIDVVERKLSLMMRNRVTPSLEFWHTTLKMLSSRKHFSICLSIYSLYGSAFPNDKVIFSCILNAALESGAPKRVTSILPLYLQACLEVQDYVIVFRMYQALSDVDGSENLFHVLKSRTTPLMLNLLLMTCVSSSQADRALKCLRQAHQYEADRCWNLQVKHRKIVDSISYNIVIKGFSAECQLDQCFECIKLMQEHGLKHDNVTLATLKDACLQLEGGAGVMKNVVNLLLQDGQPLDRATCTIFIKSFVRGSSEHLEQAVAIYEEMKRRGHAECSASGSIAIYSLMVKAFVDAHDLERALSVVEDMSRAGEKPDEVIFTHLLEGCRLLGNHALGVRLFEDMMKADVKPSEFTVATMVKLHGRCAEHQQAYKLVANCEKEIGVKPTVIHFTCLMSGCLRTKSYDQAWLAYELMLERGVEPDATAVGTLLPAMVAAQHWEHVLLIVEKALKAVPPIPVASETLNNALVQMQLAAESSCKAAVQFAAHLRDIMHSAGLPASVLSSRAARTR
mmetsp:Transcript_59833/g.104641  ORF Transcript_59833/g.104641 Transcript_59833/m.104641 type:complete len:685 (+) Transcript_59833:79-2133(+)